jgi:hypothetical protein
MHRWKTRDTRADIAASQRTSFIADSLLRTANQSRLCVLFVGGTDEMRETKNAAPVTDVHSLPRPSPRAFPPDREQLSHFAVRRLQCSALGVEDDSLILPSITPRLHLVKAVKRDGIAA